MNFFSQIYFLTPIDLLYMFHSVGMEWTGSRVLLVTGTVGEIHTPTATPAHLSQREEKELQQHRQT